MKGIPRRAKKIMLIRHAEKPAGESTHFGVTFKGEREKDSLTVRGWQRAGALANLLTPVTGFLRNSPLAQPQFIYASKLVKRNGSRRPVETVTPLAEKLGIKIKSNFPKTAVEAMVEDVFLCDGAVLICWQREFIPSIANYILGETGIAPQHFPEDRFDLVWIFDLDLRRKRYNFKQFPQNLLAGDETCAIENKEN